MKYIQEYRDREIAQEYLEAITKTITRPWSIMEVCGGQTHAIVKYGLDQLLPPELTLIHGPGCPVCVTSEQLIDQAIAIAQTPGVILCSFGDMLRVPGSSQDLLSSKAEGGDIRIVYSPLDCLKIAQTNPEKEVVFFGVGFETTAPATAMTVYQAKQQGITNFSLLGSHVLVPPAMRAILASPNCQVQGFLAAGHVCTVMGYKEYETIASQYQVPIIVTGFEPLDILQGVYLCLKQLESQESKCENQYSRSVKQIGNLPAQELIKEVFAIVDRDWRGIGLIPQSGLDLAPKYQEYNALVKFKPNLVPNPHKINECISGEIMQGWKKPKDCPAFGNKCTPEHPLGAPMVSSEGACAAYYRYRQVN
jgi:hydrogenase expression/formation protein HypD